MQASGKTPAVNALAAKIALRLECANIFTVPEHVAGKLNCDCDAFSRISQRAQRLAILNNLRRDVPKPRQPDFFGGWLAALLRNWQRQSNACARRLRQEGTDGFAVLGPAKHTAAIKGKLKGKCEEDQARQPGSLPINRGQELHPQKCELIRKLRDLCPSQLLCSIGSCRIFDLYANVDCCDSLGIIHERKEDCFVGGECCSRKAYVLYRLGDNGEGHKQAEKGFARHAKS